MFRRKKPIPRSRYRPVYSGATDSAETVSRRHRPDYSILIICLILSVIGLIVVYSISPGLAVSNNVSAGHYVSRQIAAILLGLLAFFITSSLAVKFWNKSKNILLIITFICIVAVYLLGEEVNGATRWIQLGGLSFQVAELIKLSLIVWVAAFLVERMKKNEINDNSKTLKVLIVVLGAIGLVVAGLQSDLGSSGVMVAIIGLMAFNAGLPLKPVMYVSLAVIIGTVVAISSSEYRRDRISTYLNPSADCQDSGYQACQALIAIGTGGLFGLGLDKGVQAYGYLPEAENDSIFAVLAEKLGFVGMSIVLGLYLVLISKLKKIIERTADPFSRLIVIGVLAWISTQAIINIGAMVGLLPLKGITLPFISFGGTSILFIMGALGIVFQISRYTSFEPLRNKGIEDKHREYPTNGRRVRGAYYASAGRRS